MAGFVYENGVKGRAVKVLPDAIQILTKGFLVSRVDEQISIDDITALELIDKDGVKAGTVGVAGAAGFLVAGPIGAAAGAALGAITGTATFRATLKGGRNLIFEVQKVSYNHIEKRFKVKQALASA